MLHEINLNLSALRGKLPGHFLELDDWQMTLSLYWRCDAPGKVYLGQELSNITGIALEQMSTLLVSTQGDLRLGFEHSSLITINEVLSQQRFQSQIKSSVPGIQELSMNAQEWHDLMKLLKGERGSRLTPTVIIYSLAKIKAVSYETLISCLSKKPRDRAARPVFASATDSLLPFAKRRKLDLMEKNPAIVSFTAASGLLQGDLEVTGARVIALPDPVTPQKGFSAVHATPGGTKVRCIYENAAGSVFMPLSPEQLTPLRSKGMVCTETATGELLQQALPRLQLARPEGVDFTATLPKMVARQQISRRVSQNTLMKASCRDVFAAHGIDTIMTKRGSKYHWSHLIAHFLGGEQKRENLIPGTSASNYNTLEEVEQFVANKLINCEVLSIDIRVTPIFSREALIPDELRFYLAWDEAGHHYKETIRINPRSHRRESPATLATIGIFREAARSLSLRESSSPTSSLTP